MIRFDKKQNPKIENQLSRGRVLLFKLTGILFSLFILFLLELSLRVFKYGSNLNLFIEYPNNKEYLVFNPDASKKYFTNKALATEGNVELFKKKKDEGTLRIFVLGESTTIGYPYFHNGSFHRWLQYRLMHDYPDQNFEIINLSLTAVNSYTVLGFTKELLNYKPDAILIYVGHNEYYGTLGVACTDKIGGNPFLVNLILNLRELRLTQLITNLYEKIAGARMTGSGGTRMKMMVADEQIPYDSKLFIRGINQFKYNIDKTLSLYNKYKIPVFISNLVSNEKDFKPFVNIAIDSVQFPGFEKNLKPGLKAFENNNFPLASQLLLKAEKISDANALCNFYLGKLAYKQGDFKQAKEYFVRAKDLDGLRFRAPDQLNEVIIQLCNKYPYAHMVDTRAEFENWSGDHIIGNELILEHVHPNLTGYALMSDAFYKTMKKEGIFSAKNVNPVTFKQLLRDMPVTKVDSLAGIYKISNLKKSWPFSEALHQDTVNISTEEEKLAWDLAVKNISWKDAINRLYNYYINNQELIGARKIMETLVLEYPENASFYEKAAGISYNLKDNENAIFYFKGAFKLSPTFENAKNLSLSFLKLDRPVEALPYIEYAIKNNTSNLNLAALKTSTEEVIQLKIANHNDSTNVSVLNKIARAYLKMDDKDGATIYVKKVLLMDSKNIEALSILAQIKNAKQ
jgi:tetratricopeptide (TPR) repeat protein